MSSLPDCALYDLAALILGGSHFNDNKFNTSSDQRTPLRRVPSCGSPPCRTPSRRRYHTARSSITLHQHASTPPNVSSPLVTRRTTSSCRLRRLDTRGLNVVVAISS